MHSSPREPDRRRLQSVLRALWTWQWLSWISEWLGRRHLIASFAQEFDLFTLVLIVYTVDCARPIVDLSDAGVQQHLLFPVSGSREHFIKFLRIIQSGCRRSSAAGTVGISASLGSKVGWYAKFVKNGYVRDGRIHVHGYRTWNQREVGSQPNSVLLVRREGVEVSFKCLFCSFCETVEAEMLLGNERKPQVEQYLHWVLCVAFSVTEFRRATFTGFTIQCFA